MTVSVDSGGRGQPRNSRSRAIPSAILVTFMAIPGVWWTVGPIAAGVVAGLLAIDRFVFPGLPVFRIAAVAVMGLVPFAWFAGSTLPLFPAVPRIQDNVLAHNVAGLAVWLLFLGALWGVVAQDRS